MLRVALRGLMGRRLRLLLTALAISLGVGFVAGTYVLTDTMTYAFNDLFGRITAKTDVVVRSQSPFDASLMMQTERKPLPEGVLNTVARVPGVEAAEGAVSGYAQLVGNDGKAISTTGAPTFGVSTADIPDLATWTVRQGRSPHGSTEVAVDQHTAGANHLRIGQKLRVLFQGPTRTFTLVGTFGFGDLDSMAGATVSVFDLPTAQEVLGKVGVYDEISVAATTGVSQQTLRDRIATALGPGYDVATGQTDAQRTAQSVSDALSFFSTAMLIFAGVALFVGGFIIVNTFSIIVAQRVREFGLLRALGATGGQITVSVLIEAVVLGALSSVVGLLFGLGVAEGLFRAFTALGIDMPTATLQVQGRTVLVSFAVGVGVTTGAAVVPALRARRVSPMAALQAGYSSAQDRVSRRRIVVGTALFAVGFALLLWGMYGTLENRVVVIIAGALIVFVSTASLSGLVARPLASVIGWPLAHFRKVPARLGRENAMRSPARTARTAAALMVGLGLVAFVSVFGASLKASASQQIDDVIRADYLVTGQSVYQAGFSPEVAKRIGEDPQVETVAEMRGGYWQHNGRAELVGAAVPALLNDVIRLQREAGDILHLGRTDVMVSRNAATSQGLGIGDIVRATLPVTGAQSLRVSGIYQAEGAPVDYIISMDTFEEGFTQQLDAMVGVTLRPGVTSAQARPGIEAATSDFPNVKVQDSAQYKTDQSKQIDQLLNMMYMLLALAVVIALFGIVNTLALSVFERVHELGLLRAVGMTRREVRAMVRWEAVIVSLMGALLGILVGSVFGYMAVRAVPSLVAFSYPTTQLVVFVIGAALAGVVAAAAPARRAARVDMLRAIATT